MMKILTIGYDIVSITGRYKAINMRRSFEG